MGRRDGFIDFCWKFLFAVVPVCELDELEEARFHLRRVTMVKTSLTVGTRSVDASGGKPRGGSMAEGRGSGGRLDWGTGSMDEDITDEEEGMVQQIRKEAVIEKSGG